MKKPLHADFIEQAHGQGKPDPNTLVSAIIAIGGKVPLFKRSKDGDVWYELPGGKPEPQDRDIVDTLVREMWEELGIVVVADTVVFEEMPHPYHEGRSRLFVECHHISEQPYNKLPDEHEELLMADPEDAIQLLSARITPSVAEALRELCLRQGNNPAISPAKPTRALE